MGKSFSHWYLVSLWKLGVVIQCAMCLSVKCVSYTTFKSLFSPFRGFLKLRPCVPCALTYAPVWITTCAIDWSVCTRVILLLCWGVNGLRVDVTEVQNGEKINIQIHYSSYLMCYSRLNLLLAEKLTSSELPSDWPMRKCYILISQSETSKDSGHNVMDDWPD